MNFGAQVLTNQISVSLRHQNGIFFGTNEINTRRETAVLTENRILSGFLSQFNVLSPSMYAVEAQDFTAFCRTVILTFTTSLVTCCVMD